MMATAEHDEDVLSAYICAICLDVYTSPRLLPNCEHTLCLECVHQMVATHGTTFTCPECRTLNKLGTNGVEGLKSNVALQRAIEAIKSPPPSKKQCIHLPVTKDPVLCEHCNLNFCESCLFRHMKGIQLAIIANGSTFERRITEATAVLGEKLSAAETKIDDKCESAAEKIKESCRNLKELIMASIEQSETRLLEKVRQFGDSQKSGLREMVEDHQLSQEQDLMCQVEQLKKTPLVQCTLGSLVSLYHQVENRNNEISKFEEFQNGTTLQEDISEIEVDPEAVAAIQNSLSLQFSSLEANLIQGFLDFTGQDFHKAVDEGDVGDVKRMIKFLSPENRLRLVESQDPNEFDRTPLLKAANRGHADLVRYLVHDLGAHVFARDSSLNKSTAIHLAAGAGHLEVVDCLARRSDVLVNYQDGAGNSPLTVAILNGEFAVAHYFVVEKQSNLELRNSKGQTALFVACHKGDLQMVRLLVENDADMGAKDSKRSETAVELARRKGHSHIVSYLNSRLPVVMPARR